MALPWADQVWIPGQPSTARKCGFAWVKCWTHSAVAEGEALALPILFQGCVPLPAHPWAQAGCSSWVWSAGTEAGNLSVGLQLLERKTLKESTRTEGSEELGHRGIRTLFPLSHPLGFFSWEVTWRQQRAWVRSGMMFQEPAPTYCIWAPPPRDFPTRWNFITVRAPSTAKNLQWIKPDIKISFLSLKDFD